MILNRVKLTAFDEQKILGALTSIASGGISNGLYFVLINVAKANPVMSAVFALQIFGGILAYTFDILFAKKTFYGQEVPYSQLRYRAGFLLSSVFTEMFIRFVIAVIIMSVVYYFAYKSWLKYAEENGLTFRYHEFVYALLMSISMYFLFNHVILFDYVYVETERPVTVDITMIGIMIISLLTYCNWQLQQVSKPKNN